MALSSILLATDGSPASDAAIRLLLNNDWSAYSKFCVIAVDDKVQGVGHIDLQDADGAAEKAVRQLAERYGANKVEKHVVSAQAKKAILDQAYAVDADLLVIGAHAKHGIIHEMVLGNTATHMALKSPCTVVIMRPGTGGVVNKILVCVNSPKTTGETIDVLTAQPWHQGAEFLLLNVLVLPAGEFSHSAAADVKMAQEDLDKRRSRMEAHLADSAAKLKEKLPGALVEFKISNEKNIAEAIIKAACDWGADLVVVGPREHLGVDEFLIGSVSKELLANVTCNMQFVR